MEKEFELNLTMRGFNYQKYPAGYYAIQKKNRIQPQSKALLIGSRQISIIIHGSQNGNELDAIGYYHIRLSSEQKTDYLIFAFQHLRNKSSEFMIIHMRN